MTRAAETVKRQLAALGLLLFALPAAADSSALLSLLPRHSAIVAGADIPALCGNPRSAPFFSGLSARNAGEGAAVDALVYSCDRAGRRSTVLCRFDSAEAADRMLRRFSGRLAEAEICGNVPVYRIRSEGAQRPPSVRAARIGGDTLGVYFGCPRRGSFVPDREGVAEILLRHLPRRNGMLIWCGGFPDLRELKSRAILSSNTKN